MPSTLSPTVFMSECLRQTTGYGSMLFRDIPEDRFAFKPHAKINHPAWCAGHLVYAGNGALELMGRTDLIEEHDGWKELFEMGSACVDDAGRYPGKDELVTAYVTVHEAALLALGEVDDELLARENPWESFRKMFPTVGGGLNFMLVGHHMMHLGQVSSWRRAIDMDGVMG